MLGASEGAASGDLFSVVDRDRRIYAKRESTRTPYLFHTGTRESRGDRAAAGADTVAAPRLWDGGALRKEVDRILLSKYSPPGVVVDENLEVIEIRGEAGPYLRLP